MDNINKLLKTHGFPLMGTDEFNQLCESTFGGNPVNKKIKRTKNTFKVKKK